MRAFITLALCTAIFSASFAQSLRKQIEASDKQTSKYFLAKDAKGFAASFELGVTSDFKYVENGKTMGFKEMCAGIAMGFSALKSVTKASSKIVSLTEKGLEAKVTTKHLMEGTTLDQNGKDPHHELQRPLARNLREAGRQVADV